MLDVEQHYTTGNAKIIFPVLLIAFSGTTAQATTHNYSLGFEPPFTQSAIMDRPENVETRPAYVADLNRVMELFRFKKVELAEKVFGTSRQQLDNWFKGTNANLKEQHRNTLDRLLKLGRELPKQKRIELSGTLFRAVGPNSISIAQAIADNDISTTKLAEWLNEPVFKRTSKTPNRRRSKGATFGSQFS